MQNQIKIFQHQDFGRLEMVMIDGKPYFPATECAEKLGYKNPRKAVIDHCRYVTKRDTPHPQNPDKKMERSFIPESDLYRLIIRSKLPEAVRFEKWVCDEVLPSIRQYGSFISDKGLYIDYEFIDELAQLYFNERTMRKAIYEHWVQIIPSARYCDKIMQCSDAIQVSIIAKDYGYTAVKFNKLLHALGVQYKIGKTWLLYKEHDNMGYTISYTHRTEGDASVIQTCFTQLGRKWLYNLLRSHGILPLAERTW